MAKFLKLCEQYDPDNQANTDAALWVGSMLKDANIPFTLDNDTINIATEFGDVQLKVLAFTRDSYEEDEQINAGTGTYEIDNEVEKLGDKASKGLKGLAARGLGTSAQKAKSAVRKRQNIAKQAVDAYEKGTKRIEQGLRNVRSNMPVQTRY